MIVDDERPLVALAEETLAELGYEPVGFDFEPRRLMGVSRGTGQRFDLALTDETMPDLDVATEPRSGAGAWLPCGLEMHNHTS